MARFRQGRPMPVDSAGLYLDLLKQCLTRAAFPDEYRPALSFAMPTGALQRRMQPILSKLRIGLYRRTPLDAAKRAAGQDWPADAETMIGLARLDMLQQAIQTILQQDIPGDLIETGVWRGGGAIFMRAALKAHGDTSRTAGVADSVEGLPRPDDRYSQDKPDHHWRYTTVPCASPEKVKR